jgi:hypothetical protein
MSAANGPGAANTRPTTWPDTAAMHWRHQTALAWPSTNTLGINAGMPRRASTITPRRWWFRPVKVLVAGSTAGVPCCALLVTPPRCSLRRQAGRCPEGFVVGPIILVAVVRAGAMDQHHARKRPFAFQHEGAWQCRAPPTFAFAEGLRLRYFGHERCCAGWTIKPHDPAFAMTVLPQGRRFRNSAAPAPDTLPSQLSVDAPRLMEKRCRLWPGNESCLQLVRQHRH